MSETKRYMPFRVEFLIILTPVLLMLTLMSYVLTGEILIIVLLIAICFAFLFGMIWVTHKEYRSRLGIKGLLGYLVLFGSNFVNDLSWVQLCLVLLGSGLMLYDIVSKRNLSNVEQGDG